MTDVGGDDLPKLGELACHTNDGFPHLQTSQSTHGRLVPLPHRDWEGLSEHLSTWISVPSNASHQRRSNHRIQIHKRHHANHNTTQARLFLRLEHHAEVAPQHGARPQDTLLPSDMSMLSWLGVKERKDRSLISDNTRNSGRAPRSVIALLSRGLQTVRDGHTDENDRCHRTRSHYSRPKCGRRWQEHSAPCRTRT